jgi:hypothetical protein
MGSEYSRNLSAFNEVFGSVYDPGAYVSFKSNSLRSVTIYTGGPAATRNPAQPCRADFCCDVDHVLSQIIPSEELLTKFFNHYILGINSLSKEQRKMLEQDIGSALRRDNISPVNSYFKVLRGKNGGKNGEKNVKRIGL